MSKLEVLFERNGFVFYEELDSENGQVIGWLVCAPNGDSIRYDDFDEAQHSFKALAKKKDVSGPTF